MWLALLEKTKRQSEIVPGLVNMHVQLQASRDLLQPHRHTGSCLSPGAFIPAVPVQPVVIRYPNRMVRSSLYYHTHTWQIRFSIADTQSEAPGSWWFNLDTKS